MVFTRIGQRFLPYNEISGRDCSCAREQSSQRRLPSAAWCSLPALPRMPSLTRSPSSTCPAQPVRGPPALTTRRRLSGVRQRRARLPLHRRWLHPNRHARRNLYGRRRHQRRGADRRELLFSGSAGHGFLYTGGSFTQIDVPFAGATSTEALGINNAGQIVGFFDGSTLTRLPLHRRQLHPNRRARSTATRAYGINNAGQIVGLFDNSTGAHGFLDTGGSFTQIDVPGAARHRFRHQRRGADVGDF